MNMLAKTHNKYSLQSLATPIARSVAYFTTIPNANQDDDHQLEKEILICFGK